MAEYLPRSRRPIAQMFRRTGHGATNLCVRLGISPDAISYLSLLAALIAALFFWKSGKNAWLLIIAPLFCYLRLWFNMLDGMVAVAAGKASARGEIVNDLPDRISDVTIFDWTCLIIIAGCLQTIIVRLKRIVIALQDRAR